MKAFFAAVFLMGWVWALPPTGRAQTPSDEVTPVVRFSQEEITELVAPIALYPDPLVALILPASTFPGDVVLASRFLDSGAEMAQADQKPWDPSVIGLVRYPATLKWMDENLEWTTQLGDAYLSQPEDVMDAIQELRAQAASVGNLVDTPQQIVVEDDPYIRIIPADPDYIYVPYYDPQIVYYERPVSVPLLTFSVGCEVGPWLCYDFDWHHRRLYCGEWHYGWDYRHDQDSPRGDDAFINRSLTNYRVWHGDSGRRRASSHFFAQTRAAHDRDRFLARPEDFARRSQLRDSTQRALTADGNISRSPSSTVDPSHDMNRGERNSRDRFAVPHTAVPSIAGSGAGENNYLRDDRRPHTPGDENNGNIPRALPLRDGENDRLPSGRVPQVLPGAGNGAHDSDRFRGDPRAHSQDGDAARNAAAADARRRTEVTPRQENPATSGLRHLTPHAVTSPEQISALHREVPRSPNGPSVQRPTPLITGRPEQEIPQVRILPQMQPQQHISSQLQHSPASAGVQHSATQMNVAPPLPRVAPQAPMAAPVQHNAPPQPRIVPQVQPTMPSAQAPQVRSAQSHGSNSSSDDDHRRRH